LQDDCGSCRAGPCGSDSRRAQATRSVGDQGEPQVFFGLCAELTRSLQRLDTQIQGALGANANGLPVEQALALLLRGESQDKLEESLRPAVDALRKHLEKLQNRYTKDVQLPAPTSLRIMPKPLAQEPMTVLMEMLSPEFPVFLAGAPFTYSAARAAVAVDRSVAAMDDVRLAVADFQARGAWIVENATGVAAVRRQQIEKRHLLEREQLLAVDAAAAVLEVIEQTDIERQQREAEEEKIKHQEFIERLIREQTDVNMQKLEAEAKATNKEKEQMAFKYGREAETERRINATKAIAQMWAQENQRRDNVTVEDGKRAAERAKIRKGTGDALTEMQTLELKFFDAATLAVLDVLRAKVAIDTDGLSQVMNAVTYVVNSVKPTRNDSVSCLLLANTWLAEVHDLGEDEATFFSVTAALTGVAATAVEQTMRMLMDDVLNLRSGVNNTGLTEKGAYALQTMRDIFARATEQLVVLTNTSRITLMSDRLTSTTTTTTTTTVMTTEPPIPLEDRSPAWRRRMAFIESVKKLKTWRANTTKYSSTTRSVITTFNTATLAGVTTATIPGTTPAPVLVNGTSAPSNATVIAEAIAGLSARIKGFALGLAEYDAARVAFLRKQNTRGSEFLSNAFDDLKVWEQDDLASDAAGDATAVNEHVLRARKRLAMRIAKAHGHLQVSSLMRNEGTDGVNFYGSPEQVARDVFARVDSVAANMESVVQNFKTPEDVIESSDAIGILMGGKVGKQLRDLKGVVEQFRKDNAGMSDEFQKGGNAIITTIAQGRAEIARLQAAFLAKNKNWFNVSDDALNY
jgi:hypothetical protein